MLEQNAGTEHQNNLQNNLAKELRHSSSPYVGQSDLCESSAPPSNSIVRLQVSMVYQQGTTVGVC
jgi:hypothetical protein